MKKWMIAVPLAVTLIILATVGIVAAATQVFNTSDSQFDVGVDNQGWWSSGRAGRDTLSNYVVGRSFGKEFRNFFTFDLSSLSGTVISANLELKRGVNAGETNHVYGLFDVSTDAATLNNNSSLNADIFNDLGTGTSYGTFNVPGTFIRSRDGGNLILPLNAAAVADINAAAGGFFSIGGALLNLSGSANAPVEQLILGGSGNSGIQRLVDAGLLREATGRRYDRVFVSDHILQIIES